MMTIDEAAATFLATAAARAGLSSICRQSEVSRPRPTVASTA